MGVVDLQKLNYTYRDFLKYENAHMHLVNTATGEFILNTAENDIDNIKDIDIVSDNKTEYVDNVLAGKKGRSAFETAHEGFVFASYDSVHINDWCVIIAMPEATAFAEARGTISTMIVLSLLLIFIMTLYIVFFFYDERRRYRLSNSASTVRKLLLEFGQRDESLSEALSLITNTIKSRSAFFVDTDRECYDFIRNDFSDVALRGAGKERLKDCLMAYVVERQREIFAKTVKLNAELKESNPELYSIMSEAGIYDIVFVAIWDKNNQAGIIGVANCKKALDASSLLCDVAMCFMMTVYNRKYLNETEQAAVTDSLTGLNNRMAFNRDILGIKSRRSPNISTVYIDVNELHSFNNKFGHVAGDKMLIYVSRAIVDAFRGNKIYRWGGDEFIVIAENTEKDFLVAKIEEIHRKCDNEGYHVSVGYSYSERYADIEVLLKEAEKRMYEAKARYYQDKSAQSISAAPARSHVSHISTGSADVDAALTVMSLKYQGVYVVSLNTDEARAILIPEDIEGLQNLDISFKESVGIYMDKYVSPDYHRPITNFMNYDSIKEMFKKNITPKIHYKKLDGTEVSMSVYPVDNGKPDDTIWVFEKRQ